MAAKFELYKDTKGEFRWRLVASNGQAIASSGEGFKQKAALKIASNRSRRMLQKLPS